MQRPIISSTWPNLSLVATLTLLVMAFPVGAAQVRIDLDRNMEGIQDTLTIPAGSIILPISGQVVVESITATTVSSNVMHVFMEDRCDPENPVLDPLNSNNSFAECDVVGYWEQGSVTSGTSFIWVNVTPTLTTTTPGQYLCLFRFDLVADLGSITSDEITFRFQNSWENPTLGITIDGSNYSFGPDGENPPIDAIGASIILSGSDVIPCPTLSRTKTPTLRKTPTVTQTRTITRTPSPSPTFTLYVSPTPTYTRTITRTPTASFTMTNTPTPSLSPTPSSTPTITPTLAPCRDTGYYILTGFGNHISVGSPPEIGGSVSGSEEKFIDMEPTRDLDGSIDLAILDGMGIVTFVGDPASTPSQDFYFPASESFPKGRAVDIEVSHTGQGFWVLTDFGGIYRAGDTKVTEDPSLIPGTDTLPLGYDVPFGDLRSLGFPNPGGSSLRAVGLAVLDLEPMDSLADGFIILDSQGAHYSFLGDGTRVQVDTFTSFTPHDPKRLLAIGWSGYYWPFFQGLDIARDIEIFPDSQDGVVILDGWGGIHPVPDSDPTSAIYYLNNRDRTNPSVLLTTTGMPYLTMGFDDPETTQDEADAEIYGSDAASIFVDLEFCGTGDGIYTLDRFGGVFAFGSTRATPDSVTPQFTGSPYYFPYLWAVDLEPLEAESGR